MEILISWKLQYWIKFWTRKLTNYSLKIIIHDQDIHQAQFTEHKKKHGPIWKTVSDVFKVKENFKLESKSSNIATKI